MINTAAFHRVDDCELNPALAFAVNAVGAANVARAAAETGAGVVFFSTDYVFSGEGRPRHDPHMESSKPDPCNVYGASKVAGEQLVMNANPRHLVIRSAGLYGTATSRKGSTFPELMVSKGRSDGWVKVVTDQALSPTYTHDLAADDSGTHGHETHAGSFTSRTRASAPGTSSPRRPSTSPASRSISSPRRPSLVNGAPGAPRTLPSRVSGWTRPVSRRCGRGGMP